MGRRHSFLLLLAGALLLVWTVGPALAQSDSAETPEDDPATEERTAESEKTENLVYTTDYLKKRFSDEDEGEDGAGDEEEEDEAPPAIITNESLNEQAARPTETPSAAFTNDDLQQRFGSAEADDSAAQERGAPIPGPSAEVTGEAEAGAEDARPALSPEERARRIAEVDAELARLEKRLRAIRNPLLAGTAPPTAEEQRDEEGLDNVERLRRTEARIDELNRTFSADIGFCID